ncbi:STAS domain-containing protein [Dyella psychrodurans]|uniref:Anti-sigma factor antagonist n=1 Tax=Dyella psychrodurans TaxID=1927960 RepID=A0A370XBH3_9GAMM|nr:STAS domain-containing protein [Dyella psychrodurans]RDS85773.1 anti-sigma factor antagonist [Dyella psychrodurans]
MTFSLRSDATSPMRSTLHLQGRLDALTFGEFDEAAARELQHLEEGSTLVLDLSLLEYISSAGLRSVAKIRKTMRARNGYTLLLNPQPQVGKVFEIVKAVPVNEVFKSMDELDEYLDHIQRKMLGGGEEID